MTVSDTSTNTVAAVTTEVRYHRKRDGILRVAPNGTARFLTLWERIRFWLGGRP